MRLFYNLLFIPLFLFGITFSAFGQCENDLTPPTAICNSILTVNLSDGGVTIRPEMINEESRDNCTSNEELDFRLETGATSNGSLPSATELTFEETGTYSVTLWVVDKAGNTSSCFMAVIVKEEFYCEDDKEAPLLECLNGLQTLGPNLLFAQDFVKEVSDDCTNEQNLTYGLELVADFTGNMPSEQVIEFTESGIFSVYVWVADEAGNSTFCKTKLLINETLTISGAIYADHDGDCIQGEGEEGLNQSVKLTLVENGQPIYTTIAQGNNGPFSAKIIKPTSADAKLEVSLLTDDLAACFGNHTYELNDLGNLESLAIEPIGVQLTQGCADLGVTVEAINGSCTEEGFYVIKFHNYGSEATNPIIEIEFSNPVNFNRIFATRQFEYATTSEAKINHTFYLNNLLAGEDGTIFITGQQVCAFADQTQVVTAEITADNACSNNFAGARIEISQECIGEEVAFKIKNIGQGDMLESTKFIVVEDVIMHSGGEIQLNAGESETLTFPANGATYYVRANQAADYPWQASVAKVSEGCATNLVDISTGIVAQFPLENAAPHIDVDVLENTTKVVNSLEALPKGIGENHLVNANTPVEYAIEYLNTNNEVVNNLNISVAVSEHLDLNSLKVTFATHTEYNLTVEGQTLNFSFPNIDLVSKEVSEEEGSGLLKFVLAQHPDLAAETKIESTVTISFDGEKVTGSRSANANTFFHTVGTLNFSTAIEDILQEQIELTVYPNPFHQYTTFKINNPKGLTLDFELYHANGQLMRYQQFNQHSFNLQRDHLKNGFYFYAVKHQGMIVHAGKLFVE